MSGSGGGDTSADPSILVVEAALNESLGNQGSCGKWRQAGEVEEQHRLPTSSLPLPPLADGRIAARRSSTSPSTIEAEGEDEGGRSAADRRWGDGGLNADNNHNGGLERSEEDEDDMAERVLAALQHKDMLLEEQARELQHHAKEATQLRLELDGVREEKRLLTQQLRGLLGGTTHISAEMARGVEQDARPSDLSMQPQRVDAQLQSEGAEQQQDARLFMEHIDQLMAQLTQAQLEARARETRHTQDLDVIQREMQEFSTLVEDMHATKAALRRTQEQLGKTNEAMTQCQLERDRLVRTLQDTLRREGAEHQRVRAEAHASRREAAAAEAKCHRIEAAQLRSSEEVRTLRIEMRQLVDQNAALTLRAELAEQQLQRFQKQHAEERAAAAAAHQQLHAELDAKLQEMSQLRSTHDAQSYLLAEEDKRQASFQAEVEECVHSTQQLEEAFLRCEQRRREAEERETRVSAERDALRTKLQQLAATSRRELLEQQQLAEEMRGFHQAKLQQLQQAAEHQRQRAERLEEANAGAVHECCTLQSSLDGVQQQLEAASAELHEQRLSHRAMLAASQQTRDECVAREKHAVAQLREVQGRLKRRECAWRELRAKVQRLEEREQRRHLAEAADTLLRARQERHPLQPQRKRQPQAHLHDEVAAMNVNTMHSTETSLSTAAPAPLPQQQQQQLRGLHLDAWQAKMRALESRSASLKRQLDSRQNGYHALVEDRKALRQQMHALQELVQKQMGTLERQHRDAIKHLEEVHRRRTLAASREAADASALRESCCRSGVARVVSELMAFIRALEGHAAWLMRHRAGLREAPVQPLHDGKENVLRAACDDITRNCLGVEGGWEALLHHASHANSACGRAGRNGTSLTVAMRRRIRCCLFDYMQAQLLRKPAAAAAATTTAGAAAVALSVFRGHASNKKGLNVGFAASSDGSGDGHDDFDEDEPEGGTERPLVELLMECVECVYGDGTL
ncbi:hypothetical protein TraAM80_07425 [Trypanosoma rangeli]|uniref:Uncharacterized protein n=1 Tax=Trypanosoma rangeli TaxID=5698 RepID=A0A422N5I1_TRYRA|nr:uncharacterized protein TraAM80_07425 [Trypanosoma rangeli]RNF00743.1 hypothetical protein TraAM80_07425 [Trypanosoma rangeli]|eukprot:RNF00743.1 hypothetical protein TraAM80_07425 [Trypanosoma rangeli]